MPTFQSAANFVMSGDGVGFRLTHDPDRRTLHFEIDVDEMFYSNLVFLEDISMTSMHKLAKSNWLSDRLFLLAYALDLLEKERGKETDR